MKKDKGFGLIQTLAVIIVVAVIATAGGFVYKHNHKTNNVNTTSKSATNTNTPQPVDPTASWTTYSSQTGKFSLRYPSSWQQPTNKEMCTPGLFDRALYLGPDAQSVLKCATSYFGQIYVSSIEGDKQSSYSLGSGYTDVSTQDVIVSGIAGSRISATTSGLSGEGGYKDGTKVVEYLFYTNGNTYVAHYIQAPAGSTPSRNVLSDFDLMVTKTLRFSP